MKTHPLLQIFQTAAIRWIDPFFFKRPPSDFMFRLIETLAPLVRRLQPNDQWNLNIFIDDWIGLLEIPPVKPLPPSKHIFMFGCYRGQYTQDIILAVLMAWRGHQVTYGYFPKLQSPIKEPLEDDPSVPHYLNLVLNKVEGLTKGRIKCVDLSGYRRAKIEENNKYFLAQLRADIIMKLRQENFDELDPEVVRSRRHYSLLGLTTQQIALAYLKDHQNIFNLSLIANGASFENGYFCQAAKELGIPVNTHEKFAFSKVRIVTHGDAFFQFSDLDVIWRQRERLGFLEEPIRSNIVNKAWELLRQRKNSSGSAWGWKYQDGSRSYNEGQLIDKLGIVVNQFALVCPNVPFDAGYDGWLDIFPSMREWLIQTVQALLKHSHLQVVVRAHPAENRPGYGREKISKILTEAGIWDDRLILLSGDSDINTYDLMPLCKFGVVFASTTGVEIAMHDKPVLAGASVYYGRCGITMPATDLSSYFESLNYLATAGTIEDLQRTRYAAQLYFIFHFLLQWPYPYDKPSQITAVPPKELLNHPSLTQYVETLDVLAMTLEEYKDSLPTLMASDRIAQRWGWGDNFNVGGDNL